MSITKIFAENLADALCFNRSLYSDPYRVLPSTKVFMVVHMPAVLDRELAPFNKFRVTLVPESEFASTTLSETINDPHFCVHTSVVSTVYPESRPLQNIFGESLSSSLCDKPTLDRLASVVAKMWEQGPKWGEHDAKPWQDAIKVVDITGVVLHASLMEKENEYFVGLFKESMIKTLWDINNNSLKRRKLDV